MNSIAHKRVAVIGSSGANLYSLGGNRPDQLLSEVLSQLRAAGIETVAIQLVAANGSLERARPGLRAALWSLREGRPTVVASGSLHEINAAARHHDQQLAEAVLAGEVDGLVLISADPTGTNSATVRAAALRHIPAVGTGGTSLATAQALGVRVMSGSGTTGTTNGSRAIAYSAGLAQLWGLPYAPPTQTGDGRPAMQSVLEQLDFRSVLVSALPAFIALALLRALSELPGLTGLRPLFSLGQASLPVVVAALAARRASGLDGHGTIAGVLSGALSYQGGVVGGLVAGTVAGMVARWVSSAGIRSRFPATSTGIMAGGIAGLLVGCLAGAGLAPLTRLLSDTVRLWIDAALTWNGAAIGAGGGALIWPAIRAGLYHSVILPLILIEMERSGYSFLGSLDMIGLCMVSAGILLGNILCPREQRDAPSSRSGLYLNLAFGTFVEAAEPFMSRDRRVLAGALVAAAIGGAAAGALNARGTGYLPAFIAPLISNHPTAFAIASLLSLGVACLATAAANWHARQAR